MSLKEKIDAFPWSSLTAMIGVAEKINKMQDTFDRLKVSDAEISAQMHSVQIIAATNQQVAKDVQSRNEKDHEEIRKMLLELLRRDTN